MLSGHRRTSLLPLVLLAGLCLACDRAEPPRQEAAPAPPVAAAPDSGPATPLAEGSFAYANARGNELLALDTLARPAAVRWAMCGSVGPQRAAYARRQARRDSSSNRQTADNFAREGGDVFRVAGLSTDATCYLTADTALAFGVAPLSGAQSSPCTDAEQRAASTARERAVTRCALIAATAAGHRVVLVQFAFEDTTALASLMLVTPQRSFLLDFPAAYNGPGEDIWRVDDHGLLTVDVFDILFAGTRRGVPFLGFTWAGSEGGNAYLVFADSADALRVAVHQYRYWY